MNIHLVQWQWQSSTPSFRVLCDGSYRRAVLKNWYAIQPENSDSTVFIDEVTCAACLTQYQEKK